MAMYGGDGGHTAYFTHANALGSETQTTDYAGNGAQAILFFPYGQKMSVSSNLYPSTYYQFYASLQLYDTSNDGYVPPFRPQAARMSSNTFGDATLAPFNSSYAPNLQTPVGELDLDWYTDLQGWGLGFQPIVYPVAKTVWTVTRLFGGWKIGNALPFQDPGERTALVESMNGGYEDIFTPQYMAQVCPR